MVPTLFGKATWTSSLSYTDSADVTTGGSPWTYHTQGSPVRIDSLNCSDNPYKLAWPFVQAMWEMANNINIETGNRIWATDADAIDNTADFFMNAVFDLAGVAGIRWDNVAFNILMRHIVRVGERIDKGYIYELGHSSISEVFSILEHHGLIDSDCQ